MESPCVKADDKLLYNVIELTGEDDAVELLLSGQKFSQNELNEALILACHCGYKSLVDHLVYLGANIQTKDRNGDTPLLICAENGFTKIAKFLIREKVNINIANYFGDTALLLAIRPAGSLEMVKLLLAQTGINVNQQNKAGHTALMKAIEVMDIDVIKLLRNLQDNPAEVRDAIKNCRHETAQEMADKLGIGKVVTLLPQQGTEVCKSFLAAVLAFNVDSFNILMDCHFCESLNRRNFIQHCFREVFAAHEKSGKNFSEDEEKFIHRLLECGADVHEFAFTNPVLVAITVSSYNVLQMLLKYAARLDELSSWVMKRDAKCDEFSGWRQRGLLAVSAGHGHTEIVKILLEHNPKLAAQECVTPAIINAVKNGHNECIQLLTKYGASLDIKSTFESALSNNDLVLLKYVVGNFRARLARMYLPQEMSNFVVSAAREGHVDIIGVLLDAGCNVNAFNSERKTPLMKAKNADVVDFLVKRGAVVNRYNDENIQFSLPLLYVLSKYYFQPCSADKEKIIEALLKHHASVSGRSLDGRTPLMLAVSNRESQSILQMLLDHGADTSLLDNEGSTLLHIAAENSSTENMEYLLQQTKVVNMINVQNKGSLTALMISASQCNHMAMKLLIDLGADVHIKDFGGNTALSLAISRRIQKPEILTTLLQAGCDINFQNKRGYTPLMLAAQSSLKDAVMLLVDSGANVNAVSEKMQNETALTLTAEYNINSKSAYVQYLLDHGATSSNLKPVILLRLIKDKDMQLIPKLIQSGFRLTETAASNANFYNIPASITETVSPLCMAFVTGSVGLARYFVGNLFVTKSDVLSLIYNQNMRHHLVKNNYLKCVEFLDELSTQPMSLFSLAFVAVQSAVNTAPGREERVSVLPLPQVVTDRLLFKVESVPLDMSDDDTAAVNGRSTYGGLTIALQTSRHEYDDDYDLDVSDYEHDSSSDEHYMFITEHTCPIDLCPIDLCPIDLCPIDLCPMCAIHGMCVN